MTDQSSKLGGWQRAQDAFKRAQETAKHAEVTIAVASHMLNPLAGPAAVQTHVVFVPDQQQYTQQVQMEEFRTYAESEKLQREQEAGRIVRETTQDRQEQQEIERRKSQTRHRQRGQ